MAQYLSEDLRIRVIGAIEGGMSGNGAARRFGVASPARCAGWMNICGAGGRRRSRAAATAVPAGSRRRLIF